MPLPQDPYGPARLEPFSLAEHVAFADGARRLDSQEHLVTMDWLATFVCTSAGDMLPPLDAL